MMTGTLVAFQRVWVIGAWAHAWDTSMPFPALWPTCYRQSIGTAFRGANHWDEWITTFGIDVAIMQGRGSHQNHCNAPFHVPFVSPIARASVPQSLAVGTYRPSNDGRRGVQDSAQTGVAHEAEKGERAATGVVIAHPRSTPSTSASCRSIVQTSRPGWTLTPSDTGHRRTYEIAVSDQQWALDPLLNSHIRASQE